MTKYKWLRIVEIEDLTNVELKVDDEFLYGMAMIAQRDIKEVGQQITYFKVINSQKERKMIEYTQVFDILEEDVINARRN